MAAAILNHQMTAGQALAGTTANPMAAAASGKSSTGSSSSNSATISANDFLTLLVTEMKNQDPTANTDPNEYINQLVNVNSLEQLISINQTLTTDLGTPTAVPHSTPSTPASVATNSLTGAGASGASALVQSASPGGAASVPSAINAAASKLAPGNLSVPAANPAAERVAQSLSGRPRVQ